MADSTKLVSILQEFDEHLPNNCVFMLDLVI